LREMRFEDDELETYGLKFGDIVMCEGGEPGRCAIWKEQIPGMMIQKAIHRIRCRENMDHIYLYHGLRLQGESGQLASLFTGATIKHLPREKLAKVTVVVPPAPLLNRFGEAAKPMEAQIEMLQRQIQNLRRTRDLLLPRLLSGQANIKTD
jgi:type I restriction enzyme S subunit